MLAYPHERFAVEVTLTPAMVAAYAASVARRGGKRRVVVHGIVVAGGAGIRADQRRGQRDLGGETLSRERPHCPLPFADPVSPVVAGVNRPTREKIRAVIATAAAITQPAYSLVEGQPNPPGGQTADCQATDINGTCAAGVLQLGKSRMVLPGCGDDTTT